MKTLLKWLEKLIRVYNILFGKDPAEKEQELRDKAKAQDEQRGKELEDKKEEIKDKHDAKKKEDEQKPIDELQDKETF